MRTKLPTTLEPIAEVSPTERITRNVVLKAKLSRRLKTMSVNTLRTLAVAGVLAGAMATATSAQPYPNGRIQFGGTSVAFIAQGSWGGGSLRFRGRRVPISVSGVGVGAIGASHWSAVGDVFNLRHTRDIEGTYSAINAQATAGAGAGIIDMQNEHGVEIRAHAASEGLSLSLAPTGMVIRIK
jgi:hypothetical protein